MTRRSSVLGAMNGKTVVITGGNAGIGKETAVGLAQRGAHVIITSRDPARGEAAASEIRERSRVDGEVEVMTLDLASLASIREFASELARRHDRIDVLCNNAGVMLGNRRLTSDGFEQTFGVNHLGHFVLTDLLMPQLRAAAPSRVVNVSSHAHKSARNGLDFGDLQSEQEYKPFQVYARSKLANISFTRELARRLDGSGVTANALHPGFVRSRFGRDGDTGQLMGAIAPFVQLFAISARRGARTSIYLASSPEVAETTGGYFFRCKPAAVSKPAEDDDAARRLWSASEELVAGA
jgi:NAD(P)-dependent dehydrogenase (short-subunit alcohol dehydrogenase family)